MSPLIPVRFGAAALAAVSAALAAPLPAVAAPSPDQVAVARSVADFGSALYLRLRHGNTVVSPFSVTSALTGIYAGSRGSTQQELRGLMRTSLDAGRYAAGLGAINDSLAQAGGDGGDAPQLSSANSLWADAATTPRADFVSTVRSYGADFQKADFQHAAAAARDVINKWVADRTGGRIDQLFGSDAITAATRLVIANAVYFKGRWENEFDTRNTRRQSFHRSGAAAVRVKTMHAVQTLAYASSKDWQAVDVPYRGGRVSLLVIVPRKSLGSVEKQLSGTFLARVTGRLRSATVTLALPRFEFRGGFDLLGPLRRMGGRIAFGPRPDLTGMFEDFRVGDLDVSKAVHKTFIHVDEEGTEAAAATGAVVSVTSAPVGLRNVKVTANRPFLAIIRDSGTGVPLFIVRVTDPSK